MSQTLDELKLEIEGGNADDPAQANRSSLPKIPKQGSGSKFSSWNINAEAVQKSGPAKSGQGSSQELHADFMDEVDELLLEQELLSPTAADKTMKSMSSRQKLGGPQSNKENKKGKENERVDLAVKKNITQSPELQHNDGPSKKRQQIEKLRDSTLEKLLNGEKDLGDLDIDGLEEMSPADRQTLRKKLSNSLNKKKDAKQNGQQNDLDEFIMQDISDDLNQLLDNYDDLLQPGKGGKGKKEANGGGAGKKAIAALQGKGPGLEAAARAASAAVIKDSTGQRDDEDSWVLSPLKNQKLNSNSQLNNKKTGKDFKKYATLKEPEANDIDSLVEEELSRNQSEDCSVEDELEDKAPGSHNAAKQASPSSNPGDSKSNGGSNQKGKNITDNNGRAGSNYGSMPAKKGLFGAAQQRRASAEPEPDGKSDDPLGSSGGKESQMFKDLFQTANKSKGIAGIQNVKISSKGSGVIHNEGAAADLDLSMNGGPKLVSSKKTEELQMLAQMQSSAERQLNKNRSKKDLKNKFKSSSAIYTDGVKTSEPEDEDDIKGDADAKNISEIIQRHIQKEEAEKAGGDKGQAYPVPAGLAGSGLLANNLDAIKNGKGAYQIDDSEIDEIIKQHLIEEEQTSAKEKLKVKKKKSKGGKKKSSTEVDATDKKEASTTPEDEIDAEENTHSGDDDYDDDELDQHGDDDEIDDETVKAKKRTPDDDDDDPYDFLDDSLNLNVKSPKLTLIEHLRLLADIFNSSLDEASEYYDQIFDERAQFMLDFENILKIMTFDETVEFVLPCMQIYSSEQDYLKLKLFQNLEKLFKKLFKAEVFIPKSEIIDIITINIFPLASRMLMLSEEPVQVEGVEALLNLSKQYIPKDQAQNLVLKVIQVIMDRISPQSEHQEIEEVKEKAKIAILIIVQKFADADVFEKEQCQNFLDNHLEDIQDGMLFKIKKFVMPALIAVSKHLTHEGFIEKVYKGTFQQFNNDEIWGVRKVCIENLANLMKYLRHDDVSRITECIEFFKRCLNDSNRWVKNQALIQFGPIVHQIYLKYEQLPDGNRDASGAQLKELINTICMSYYDLKLIFGDKDDLENSLMEKLDDYSFMQNKTDDVDKVKYYWAYNLPCALLVNGKSDFWFTHMKNVYELLYKDVLINLRTTIASSFKEIIDLLEIDKMKEQDERQFFVTVLNHFLKDSEEISAKVLPTICKLISKFPEEEKTELLDNLVRTKIESIKTMKNGRDTMVKMLEQLFDMFAPGQLLDANYHDYLFDIIKNERAINYKLRAAKVIGSKIISPLIKGKKYRGLLTTFTDDLRVSKHFRDRQIYIQIAESTYESDNEIFKKHFAKNIAQDLEQEPCRCVQISLARLCNTVQEGYSKSLDKIRQKLLADDEPTVIQYMPQSSQKANSSELDRRYLAIGYGDEANGVDTDKQMTEEEWLEKERKEIAEVEKTVTIRFANYSTLMRAQTLTQGLSAQLAVFLSSMGVSGQQASSLPANALLQKAAAAKNAKAGELNQKLFDKAQAKDQDMQEQKTAKLRSLSPLGILDDDKDTKLDSMLDGKQANDDDDADKTDDKNNNSTDSDSKNAENGKMSDKESDKTIQELENLEKL